jgi:O-methyltransferase
VFRRRERHAVRDDVDPELLEHRGRSEFFFNAFKARHFNGIGGDYAEFGSGRVTFGLAYRESRRYGLDPTLWAFDSFRGLPRPVEGDAHPRWIEGKMATTLEEFHGLAARNGIPKSAYRVVPGFFSETLARASPDEQPTDLALAYVDCDFYSSTRDVLAFLEPRLKHGMIVAFDDYFCWSATDVAGERKAMLELAARNARWDWVPYVNIGWHGMSFVIEKQRGGRSLASPG